jgi:anti-sigma28 factor (negative regulator of flagellin synthesis)
MKVTNSDTSALTGAAQAQQTSAGSAASRSRADAAGSSSDRVQLSSLSGHLRALSANSEARAQHLGSIETAVGSGNYRPDSSAVSGKIIEQSMRGESAA